MKFFPWCHFLFLFFAMAPVAFGQMAPPEKMPPLESRQNLLLAQKYQSWGEEVLKKIETDYLIASRGIYSGHSADTDVERKNDRRGLAMMWACGVQLSALAEAASLDAKKNGTALISFAKALDVFIQQDEFGGYDVLPCPKPKDRYYDDNVWVVLALLKAYETNKDAAFLTRAENAMKFVLSGEDDKTGGGIYWKETDRVAKHACSTAPTIVACVKLYRINKKFPNKRQDYLKVALRLHDWMRATLQDTDGLYWDNININGKISKPKYSYNSALMVRAEVLLFQETNNKKYLEEAQRVARAMLIKYVREDGSADDGGRFGHLMMGAFLELYKVDKNALWLRTCDGICEFVHAKLRGKNGLYSGGWREPIKNEPAHVDLLDQASVAHAFLETARAHRENRNTR